jgi:hypothetical protein
LYNISKNLTYNRTMLMLTKINYFNENKNIMLLVNEHIKIDVITEIIYDYFVEIYKQKKNKTLGTNFIIHNNIIYNEPLNLQKVHKIRCFNNEFYILSQEKEKNKYALNKFNDKMKLEKAVEIDTNQDSYMCDFAINNKGIFIIEISKSQHLEQYILSRMKHNFEEYKTIGQKQEIGIFKSITISDNYIYTLWKMSFYILDDTTECFVIEHDLSNNHLKKIILEKKTMMHNILYFEDKLYILNQRLYNKMHLYYINIYDIYSYEIIKTVYYDTFDKNENFRKAVLMCIDNNKLYVTCGDTYIYSSWLE